MSRIDSVQFADWADPTSDCWLGALEGLPSVFDHCDSLHPAIAGAKRMHTASEIVEITSSVSTPQKMLCPH